MPSRAIPMIISEATQGARARTVLQDVRSQLTPKDGDLIIRVSERLYVPAYVVHASYQHAWQGEVGFVHNAPPPASTEHPEGDMHWQAVNGSVQEQLQQLVYAGQYTTLPKDLLTAIYRHGHCTIVDPLPRARRDRAVAGWLS